MATFWSRARPLAALGAGAALVAPAGHRRQGPVHNEAAPKKEFVRLKCIDNQAHTHDTRKITFATAEPLPAQAVVNVQVRAPLGGGTCCACCKCGPSCACPKRPDGCCACCTCPQPCTCPKAAPVATCCACCKCGPGCTCPKRADGCCACCQCPQPCGCPKLAPTGGGLVTRMYNPLSVQASDKFTLLVKKYEGSLMGTHLHGLKVGDAVEVKGPNKQKGIEKGTYAEYALIAGGTGITPLIQAAEHVLANDTAKVTLVCLNKSVDDRLLMQELEAMKKAYPSRLVVKHVVGKSPGMFARMFSPDIILEGGALLPTPQIFAGILPPPSSNVMVMVCGRGEMTGAIAGPKTKDFKQGELAGVLKELGYSSSQVWKM